MGTTPRNRPTDVGRVRTNNEINNHLSQKLDQRSDDVKVLFTDPQLQETVRELLVELDEE